MYQTINLTGTILVMNNWNPVYYKSHQFLLFRKRQLLTREDLTIPWRPFYELVKSVRFSKLAPMGLEKFPRLVSLSFTGVLLLRIFFFNFIPLIIDLFFRYSFFNFHCF